jgi:phosphoglycolate phosphatase-like HAD superfamily hydrolase
VTGAGPVLRIAFDMDGVLADMHAALSIEAERMFTRQPAATAQALEDSLEQEPPAPLIIPPQLGLTREQTEELWRRVAGTHDFWDGLAETEPGIVARLAQIAERRRWEVIFLTQRPPTRGSTVQKQTQAWLRRHGYDCPSVYTTRGSRGAIAAALNLDVVIDDRFEGCVDVADESNARAVLVWRLADDSVPVRARRMGITVVRSAGECLALLDHDEQPRAEAAGLFARLRQVFRRRNPRDAR